MSWIKCSDKMPDPETIVLIVINGRIDVGALYWEYPGFEDSWKAFTYWDHPHDDGQCWEHNDITHWMPLPDLPDLSEFTHG